MSNGKINDSTLVTFDKGHDTNDCNFQSPVVHVCNSRWVGSRLTLPERGIFIALKFATKMSREQPKETIATHEAIKTTGGIVFTPRGS